MALNLLVDEVFRSVRSVLCQIESVPGDPAGFASDLPNSAIHHSLQWSSGPVEQGSPSWAIGFYGAHLDFQAIQLFQLLPSTQPNSFINYIKIHALNHLPTTEGKGSVHWKPASKPLSFNPSKALNGCQMVPIKSEPATMMIQRFSLCVMSSNCRCPTPAEVCLELCFTKMLGFLWCHGFDKIADIADLQIFDTCSGLALEIVTSYFANLWQI